MKVMTNFHRVRFDLRQREKKTVYRERCGIGVEERKTHCNVFCRIFKASRVKTKIYY